MHRHISVLSLLMAFNSFVYGYLTLTMSNPPYGELTRPLGILSILFGFVIVYSQYRYLRGFRF